MAALLFERSLSKEINCRKNQKGKKLVRARRDRKKIIKARVWGAEFTLVQ